MRLTHIAIESTWARADIFITLLLILGLTLNAWGIVFNATVVMANKDTMPVITEQPIFLLKNNGVPRVLTNEGNLLLLADRIKINFPDMRKHVPSGPMGIAVRWWSKWLDYPLEGGLNMVSVGDLMRWSGSIIFLLMIPIIIIATLRRLLSGDRPRFLM